MSLQHHIILALQSLLTSSFHPGLQLQAHKHDGCSTSAPPLEGALVAGIRWREQLDLSSSCRNVTLAVQSDGAAVRTPPPLTGGIHGNSAANALYYMWTPFIEYYTQRLEQWNYISCFKWAGCFSFANIWIESKKRKKDKKPTPINTFSQQYTVTLCLDTKVTCYDSGKLDNFH